MASKKIVDVCKKVCSGGTPNRKHLDYYENGIIPWLNTGEVAFNRIYHTEKFITEKGLDNSSAKWIPANSVIVAMYGATAARVAISKIPLTTNQACCNLVIDENVADYRYVYYYLYNQYAKLASLANGGAQQNLNAGQIKEYPIDLPSLRVQKSIADVLSFLDDKIEVNSRINDNLLDQAQTLYKQHFPYSVQDDLPDGWRIGTVGEIIEIHDSKRIPLSGADRMKMEKKIYPYYGAASLMDYVDNYIFDGKYLLLGEDGTVVDDAGYPILQYVWGQFWVNNHAHILTGRLGFNVESLYMLFKQTPVKSIVTGAVQPKISQANLRSVQVVIPPEHNLKEYNDLVEPLFSLLRANEEECKSLAALRDTLLPKLMSGEIDVSDIQL